MLELGYLYWDDGRYAAARHWYEQALARLEAEYSRSPSNLEVCYDLGTCLVRLGACLPDDVTNETRAKLATRAVRLFEHLIEQGYREVDSRAGLSIASYRLVWARFDGKDQQGLLKSLAYIATLDEAARKVNPSSPYLNSLTVFVHHDNADALLQSGNRRKEALAEREAAVAKAREIANQSPDVSRYGNILTNALNKLGMELWRAQRSADSQAAYEESARIIDGLVRRFPDRASLASWWVESRNDLAFFLEYGPKPQGEIQAKQDLLRTLDQTIPLRENSRSDSLTSARCR